MAKPGAQFPQSSTGSRLGRFARSPIPSGKPQQTGMPMRFPCATTNPNRAASGSGKAQNGVPSLAEFRSVLTRTSVAGSDRRTRCYENDRAARLIDAGRPRHCARRHRFSSPYPRDRGAPCPGDRRRRRGPRGERAAVPSHRDDAATQRVSPNTRRSSTSA